MSSNLTGFDLLKARETAWDIAKDGHKDQFDKNEVPYIEHIKAVYNNCDTLESQIVAILHDTLEDTVYNEVNLIIMGIPEEFVKIVKLLTRSKEESYNTYIERVSTNPIAIKVKIADLIHNMDISRFKKPLTIKDFDRLHKYHHNYLKLIKLQDEK